jgi:hypothetical protein
MYARAIDDAAVRLRDLRREEIEDLGLGALVLAAAVGATQLVPALALPLFVGGLVVGARGLRALWRRWDLVERLTDDRDAYVISEVHARASREATLERRRSFAIVIRSWLRSPGPELESRIAAARPELEALVAQLEDPDLALEPACAVACLRLVSDPAGSPLLNTALPPAELRSRVRQIRSGFSG